MITGHPGVELNPTVMLLGSFDWLPLMPAGVSGHNTSRCIESVKRAVALAGGTRLNFVPTLYWRDELPEDGVVDSFCYVNHARKCTPFTAAAINAFRIGVKRCFRVAVKLGMDISVVPHLDDGSPTPAWRNSLVFNPRTKYGGFSYEDVMLNPIADAMRAVMRPNTRVWMAMQGEMSATLCHFPKEYMALHERLKTRIAGEPKGRAGRRRVKVGVALNFNKLDTGIMADPSSSLTQPAKQPGVDKKHLQRLFEMMDFVGISSYPALTPNFTESELQNSAFMFFDEFNAIGIDLAGIMAARNIELHYTEYGVGGGMAADGNSPALTANQTAFTPFYGVWGSYHRATDPWAMPGVLRYMHSFYERTLHWLEQGGGPTYKITACFLWSHSSWDVLGIYNSSTTEEGSYCDDHVAAIIKAHNARMAALHAIGEANATAAPNTIVEPKPIAEPDPTATRNPVASPEPDVVAHTIAAANVLGTREPTDASNPIIAMPHPVAAPTPRETMENFMLSAGVENPPLSKFVNRSSHSKSSERSGNSTAVHHSKHSKGIASPPLSKPVKSSSHSMSAGRHSNSTAQHHSKNSEGVASPPLGKAVNSPSHSRSSEQSVNSTALHRSQQSDATQGFTHTNSTSTQKPSHHVSPSPAHVKSPQMSRRP